MVKCQYITSNYGTNLNLNSKMCQSGKMFGLCRKYLSLDNQMCIEETEILTLMYDMWKQMFFCISLLNINISSLNDNSCLENYAKLFLK